METYSRDLAEASQFIRNHDDFLVIAHLHPDGDATGSALAVGHLLNNIGKKYTMVNEGDTPLRFSYLSGYDQIINLSQTKLNRTFSAVIAVDVADYKRLGDVEDILSESCAILNIDHHPTNTCFGQINVIRSTAASTTEILFDLISTLFPDELDNKIAEALYTGLLTDTGGFRYSNTTQHVLEMAASLLSFGVKPGEIAEHALETISSAHLKLLKHSIQTLSFAYNEKVAFIAVSTQDMKDSEATKDDVDGLVSYPRNIEGVEVGVLLKEWEEGEVKVSLRSKNEVDVAVLAQKFGGGGHAKASGYSFKGSLSEAKEHLIKELEEQFGD
jgi:phosphoesterase RecJ-like protein